MEWIIPEMFWFKEFNNKFAIFKGSKWRKGEVMVQLSPLSALIVRKCNQCTRDRGDSFWSYIIHVALTATGSLRIVKVKGTATYHMSSEGHALCYVI